VWVCVCVCVCQEHILVDHVVYLCALGLGVIGQALLDYGLPKSVQIQDSDAYYYYLTDE